MDCVPSSGEGSCAVTHWLWRTGLKCLVRVQHYNYHQLIYLSIYLSVCLYVCLLVGLFLEAEVTFFEHQGYVTSSELSLKAATLLNMHNSRPFICFK